MRISSTGAIEGGRVLYTIGRIEAASTWHPALGSPCKRAGGSLSYANSCARPKISPQLDHMQQASINNPARYRPR
jgi:hypothetical protein